MRVNGGSASSSSGWNNASPADAEAGAGGLQLNLGGRRSSSSRGRLAGGAAFGALVFTPGPVFDEDAVGDGEVDDMFGTFAWK